MAQCGLRHRMERQMRAVQNRQVGSHEEMDEAEMLYKKDKRVLQLRMTPLVESIMFKQKYKCSKNDMWNGRKVTRKELSSVSILMKPESLISWLETPFFGRIMVFVRRLEPRSGKCGRRGERGRERKERRGNAARNEYAGRRGWHGCPICSVEGRQ